jgi:signal transduction histidine kinase
MYIQCPDDVAIFADERRMKQVLLNLISNAINYSPSGGLLTVAAVVKDKTVEISVKDTGMGIPKDDLQHVFTPFERIRSRKAHRRGGAGLGLSLVKSIVQLHGGDVAIESREGVGTTVTCRLPLGHRAIRGAVPPPETPPTSQG